METKKFILLEVLIMEKLFKAIAIAGVLVLCIPAFVFTVSVGLVKNFIDAIIETFDETKDALPFLGESIKEVWNA